jgi:7-keto-8-aminopelargonate synthetase-like enzyme
MILISSLAKGFGAGGGVAVCHDDAMYKRIITCSAPLIFSLPVGSAASGAIVESCKIHTSPEMPILQKSLKEKINLFTISAKEFNVPILVDSKSPVFFIPVGKTEMCYEMVRNLLDRGYFVTIGSFPSVPKNNAGIRIAITLLHSNEDIRGLLRAIKEEFEIGMAKYNITMAKILSFYKLAGQKSSEETEQVYLT